jgi:pSer/pThr/pTyr-binding forkhead associated (FHA) protein
VEVALEQDGLIFGRAPDATIELPFAKVSARHARLFREAGSYRVEDLGSTNGTRLAGRKLTPRVPEAIAFGEVIEIGGVEIRCEGERPSALSIPAAASTQTLARRLVHDVFETCPPAEQARLVVLSGPEQGRELVLAASGRVFKLGRGEGCDLALSDEDVSREHAAIERGPGGFALRDLGSKNGVEVAGEGVVGERRLRDGDVIRVGETHLRLVDPEDRYLRRMEAAEAGQRATAPSVEPAGGAETTVAPGRLPAIAMAIAVTVLLLALGLVLALAFVAHL